MELSFNKQDLSYATSITHSIVAPTSTMPILGNILIRSEKKTVKFIASDLQSCVECTIKADVKEDGEITIPAETFNGLVQELPEAEVKLKIKDTHCMIHCEGNEYRLQTMSCEDFPIWSGFEVITSFKMPQKTLRRMISKTIFAIPLKDPRKSLLGGFFELVDGKMKIVGTDGKRLGFSEVEVSDLKGSKSVSAIIPHKVLSELQRILKDEGEVSVNIGANQCSFDLGEVVFYTKVIEGTYPNYTLVIPKDFEYEIVFEVSPLAQIVRRAAVISETKNNSIKLNFKKGSGVDVTAITYDIGSFEGSLPVSFDGEDFEIAFNFRFLLDVLKNIESKTLLLKIKAPASPVIIEDPEDKSCFFLLMPIKITELEETVE